MKHNLMNATLDDKMPRQLSYYEHIDSISMQVRAWRVCDAISQEMDTEICIPKHFLMFPHSANF